MLRRGSQFRIRGKSTPRPWAGGAAGGGGRQASGVCHDAMKANAGRFSGLRLRHLQAQIYMLISYFNNLLQRYEIPANYASKIQTIFKE